VPSFDHVIDSTHCPPHLAFNFEDTQRALQKLTPEDALIFLDHYFHGKNYREIAEMRRLSKTEVQRRIAISSRIIRTELERSPMKPLVNTELILTCLDGSASDQEFDDLEALLIDEQVQLEYIDLLRDRAFCTDMISAYGSKLAASLHDDECEESTGTATTFDSRCRIASRRPLRGLLNGMSYQFALPLTKLRRTAIAVVGVVVVLLSPGSNRLIPHETHGMPQVPTGNSGGQELLSHSSSSMDNGTSRLNWTAYPPWKRTAAFVPVWDGPVP
jgi:hypothetical protein